MEDEHLLSKSVASRLSQEGYVRRGAGYLLGRRLPLADIEHLLGPGGSRL